MDVSELEQDLACKNDQSPQLQRLFAMIDDKAIHPHDKVKLSLLYQLRYETSKDVRATSHNRRIAGPVQGGDAESAVRRTRCQ